MANSAGSKKRARQAVKHNKHNAQIRSRLRTFVKKTVTAIEAGDKTTAEKTFTLLQSIIDSAVGKGLVHKNNAARKKHRLVTKISAL